MSRSKPLNDLSLDALRLALSIVEGPSLKVSGVKLTGSGSSRFKKLLVLGALVRKERAKAIICQDCDRRHQATVTFDRESGATTYFCPDAGRVTIEADALDVYEFRLDWLLDWIAKALRITAKHRPITLIKGHLWELGEASIHQQLLRIMLARQIESPALLAQVETVGRSRIGKTGLILTTSSNFSEPRRLPNGFSMISLGEIVSPDRSAAVLDLDRLLSVAEPEATIDPYSTGMPGRKSGAQFVRAEHERRISDGEALNRIGEESRELERWYAEHHRDGPKLKVDSIANIIRADHIRQRTPAKSTK